MSAERAEASPAGGRGAAGPIGEVWRFTLSDRPGALERVLGVLRRRLVPIEALSLTRRSEEELDLELRLRIAPEQTGRVRAELDAQVDVRTPDHDVPEADAGSDRHRP